jgi:hypothetical protein
VPLIIAPAWVLLLGLAKKILLGFKFLASIFALVGNTTWKVNEALIENKRLTVSTQTH